MNRFMYRPDRVTYRPDRMKYRYALGAGIVLFGTVCPLLDLAFGLHPPYVFALISAGVALVLAQQLCFAKWCTCYVWSDEP